MPTVPLYNVPSLLLIAEQAQVLLERGRWSILHLWWCLYLQMYSLHTVRRCAQPPCGSYHWMSHCMSFRIMRQHWQRDAWVGVSSMIGLLHKAADTSSRSSRYNPSGRGCRCPFRSRSSTVRSCAHPMAQPASSVEYVGSGKTFHHGITYITYEGNTFWVKFNNSGTMTLASSISIGAASTSSSSSSTAGWQSTAVAADAGNDLQGTQQHLTHNVVCKSVITTSHAVPDA